MQIVVKITTSDQFSCIQAGNWFASQIQRQIAYRVNVPCQLCESSKMKGDSIRICLTRNRYGFFFLLLLLFLTLCCLICMVHTVLNQILCSPRFYIVSFVKHSDIFPLGLRNGCSRMIFRIHTYGHVFRKHTVVFFYLCVSKSSLNICQSGKNTVNILITQRVFIDRINLNRLTTMTT